MLRLIARSVTLRKEASSVSTKVTPLSEIRNAFVLLDRNAYDFAAAEDRVKEYFSSKGIRSHTYLFDSSSLNWFGKPKKTPRGLKGIENGLFISLFAKNDFTTKYCAVASEAVCKVGREQIEHHQFDILMIGEDNSQVSVFNKITDLLEHVQ